MTDQTFVESISRFVPNGTALMIVKTLEPNKVNLTVSKTRSTKFGDYRPPKKGSNLHYISVNGSLDKYSFLITLLHEIAHLKVYSSAKKRAAPHGVEWQETFTELARPYLSEKFFPQNILVEFNDYLTKPKASTVSHTGLYRELKRLNSNGQLFIEDLNIGDQFNHKNRLFTLGEKRRTRYLCTEVVSNKKYLFNAVAEVNVTDI
jgi:SprT protein